MFIYFLSPFVSIQVSDPYDLDHEVGYIFLKKFNNLEYLMN
jgi:hypothetical protein